MLPRWLSQVMIAAIPGGKRAAYMWNPCVESATMCSQVLTGRNLRSELLRNLRVVRVGGPAASRTSDQDCGESIELMPVLQRATHKGPEIGLTFLLFS